MVQTTVVTPDGRFYIVSAGDGVAIYDHQTGPGSFGWVFLNVKKDRARLDELLIPPSVWEEACKFF